MDQKSEQRARLWLRSERAMGLSSVPRPKRRQPASQAPVTTEVKPQPAEKSMSPHPDDARVQAVVSELTLPTIDRPFDAPVLSAELKQQRLTAMNEDEVRGCTRCRLCQTRTQTVFGEGDVNASIFFIGEGPGENEDLAGRPFVGRAGQKLNDMIRAMGLKREEVYIANIVKCRPPGNRVPSPDEVATCTPYLERQLEIVRPKVIVTLGLPAMQYMLQVKSSMSQMRGRWHSWRGIKLMPTYHPAYLLRNYTYQTRVAVWSDLKQVLEELGLPVPDRKKAE